MGENEPELIVTNFNRNFTGVSATAAAVTRSLARRYRLVLCGEPLPGCPSPIGRIEALRLSHRPPQGRPFVLWHVRRNTEMRLALVARDLLRLPVKIVFTSSAKRLHSAFPRWLISRMDAVIATSDAAAGFVPHVRAVAPHGVDTEVFVPAEDRKALWAASGFPGERGIAIVGRLRPEKGTDVFVRAMIETLPRFPGTVAVAFGEAHAGDRSFLNGLKGEIAAAGLSDRILFPGETPPERLARLLPAFSLLVASPRYEGYGMTVLEGMAAGVPFVATDAGIFRDFSDEGRAGEIVPVGDVAKLASAVADWLAASERLEAAARAARAHAALHYSVEREAAAVAGVYEALWEEG